MHSRSRPFNQLNSTRSPTGGLVGGGWCWENGSQVRVSNQKSEIEEVSKIADNFGH